MKADKFVNMRRSARKAHESGIGNGLRHLALAGFPQVSVCRSPAFRASPGNRGDFTHWTIVPAETMSIRLSKSRIQSGRQCHKRLWLELHEPDQSNWSPAAQARLDEGTRFGELARELLGGGVLVAADHLHVKEALAETADICPDRDRTSGCCSSRGSRTRRFASGSTRTDAMKTATR
jgi:hypothetical protein